MPEGINPSPESKQRGPDRIKRMRHLCRIFERGLDSRSIVALHGTSLEAIQSLIKTGVLPGSRIANSPLLFGREGSLYVFPTLEYLKSKKLDYLIKRSDYQEFIETGSRGYASDQARIYSLAGRMEINLDDPKHYLDIMDLSSNVGLLAGWQKYFPGKSKIEAIKLIEYSRTRKGLVLGLDKSMLQEVEVKHDGRQEDEGWYIEIPNGLDYKYLAGLEPEGQEEWDYFGKMQRDLKK